VDERPVTRRSPDFYQKLPKVELHRHLEGSVRLNTLIEVARTYGLTIPSTGHLRPLVQVTQDEPYTIKNFMSKFDTLRQFYRSPEIIGRVTREAVYDAASDNVRYLELRFTPVALSKAQDFSLAEVMDWVIEAAHQASKETGTQVGLIASTNRHESPEVAAEVIRLATKRTKKGILAVDLAGREADFSALPFAPAFKEARKAGLHVTIHAGEWGGAANVAEAVAQLGAERIGHGVRVLEDPQVVALARQNNTVFEVCITSNYQSGVVTNLQKHPFAAMLAAGLNVTLNTDDPSISQIRLSDEYRIACEELRLPLSVLKERVLAAGAAAFLPPKERQKLVQQLTKELDQHIKNPTV
jgi:adenosine deaminase